MDGPPVTTRLYGGVPVVDVNVTEPVQFTLQEVNVPVTLVLHCAEAWFTIK